MDPKTITAATFTMQQGTDIIRGTVSYSDTTAFLMLPNGLAPDLLYTCTITTGVRDIAGTALLKKYVWTFRTIAPGTPTLVSPANATTGLPANPVLAWNAVSRADSYRLQVSLSPAFVSTVYDDSTRHGTEQQVAGLVPGTTYYWRVNSKISGQSGAYSDVSHFTTLAMPVAPIVNAPQAGAGNQPTLMVLSWLPTPAAETYRLQISTSPIFVGASFYDSTVAGSSQLVNGFASGTTYYWRVNAKNTAGTSPFSSRSFTTVVAQPPAPVQTAPLDASPNDSTIQTLDWSASVRATSYRLQIDTSSVFASTVFDDSTIVASSKTVSGLKIGQTYFWRVNAKNAGGTSAFSKTWRFTVTTVGVLKAPVLISPLDSALNISTHPTFDWNTSVGADNYTLQVDTSIAFASPVYDSATITTTSQSITGLTVGKTYFWHVRAKYSGGKSAFSATRRFTVALILPPLAPVLASPSDSAVKVPRNPSLSWNASAGATSYRLQVDTSALFSNPFLNDSTLAGLSKSLAGLTDGKTYFWRVNAKNSGGTSPNSQVRRFTVDSTQNATINLGAAQHFGSMGSGAGLTNHGIFTQIKGSIGTPGASTLITGFHDGTASPSNVFTETPLDIGAVSDTIYTATAPPGSIPGKVATDALAAAQTAFDVLKGLPPGSDPAAGELGGLTLAPGTYTSAGGTFKITLLDLTLDAQGDPNARFVFQMPSSLTVGAAGPLGARSVNLINGAQAKNVYWVVGTGGSGAATINGSGGGTMVGTIIAFSGISFSTVGNVVLTRLEGRAISLNASVTLVNTIINVPSL